MSKIISLLFIFLFISCSEFKTSKIQVLNGVEIGNSIWSNEDLKITKFRNGDEIIQSKNYKDWDLNGKQKVPTWAFMNFDSVRNSEKGKIYNQYVISYIGNIAPLGWHLPNNENWADLFESAGGIPKYNEFDSTFYRLKSKTGWEEHNLYHHKFNGSDIFSFNAKPILSREISPYFKTWWTSTIYESHYRRSDYDIQFGIVGDDNMYPFKGAAIRLVSDQAPKIKNIIIIKNNIAKIPCSGDGDERCIQSVRDFLNNKGYRILGEEYIDNGIFGISYLDASRGEAYNINIITDCDCNIISTRKSIIR